MADNRRDKNGKNRNKELKRLNIFRLKWMKMDNNTFGMDEKMKSKKHKISKTYVRVNEDCLSGVILRYFGVKFSFMLFTSYA